MDRVADFIGGGTSRARWVIDGTRASGAPFQVDVRNRYASPWDISFESLWDSWSQLERIQGNRFEKVKITGVRYDAAMSDEFKLHRQGVPQAPQRHARADVLDPVGARATGSRLNLRVVLNQYQNAGPQRTVDLSVAVPAGSAGGSGRVNVTGRTFGGDGGVNNFDDLLTRLRSLPPNNAVNARLSLDTRSGFTQRRTRRLVDQVVTGRFSFPIRVVPASRSLPAVVDDTTWKLRSSLTNGTPTTTFAFGNDTFRQLMGDFNGNGKASPAIFTDGTCRVRMFPRSSTARVFTFGQPGDIPVVGDWDGDGKDGIGVYHKGRWLLRDTTTAGPLSRDFRFGGPAAMPVAGDWNGNGIDTAGTVRDGWWRLRNTNTAGAPAHAFGYGVTAGDRPIVGD